MNHISVTSSEIHLQDWHNGTSKPSSHHHEIMKDEFGYYLMSNSVIYSGCRLLSEQQNQRQFRTGNESRMERDKLRI